MGVRPWEHARLTVAEFDQACADIDAYLASGALTHLTDEKG